MVYVRKYSCESYTFLRGIGFYRSKILSETKIEEKILVLSLYKLF